MAGASRGARRGRRAHLAATHPQPLVRVLEREAARNHHRRSRRLARLHAPRGPARPLTHHHRRPLSTPSRPRSWRPTTYGRPGRPIGPRVGPVCLEVVRVATPGGRSPGFPVHPGDRFAPGGPPDWSPPLRRAISRRSRPASKSTSRSEILTTTDAEVSYPVRWRSTPRHRDIVRPRSKGCAGHPRALPVKAHDASRAEGTCMMPPSLPTSWASVPKPSTLPGPKPPTIDCV
jgi:hypothetical protein